MDLNNRYTSYRAVVPKLWHIYHLWHEKAFKVVRE